MKFLYLFLLAELVILSGTRAFTNPVISSNNPPQKSEWSMTASSTQEDLYLPTYACDGNIWTRWASDAHDPEWLQIDFGRNTVIGGLKIRWETAFSSEYQINVSPNGQEWSNIFQTDRGDGHTDYIYFNPVTTRMARITGTKRGTGWGHSIWEIDALGPEEYPLVFVGTNLQTATGDLFDGRLTSEWQSFTTGTIRLTLDLRNPKPLGGARIHWGSNYAQRISFQRSVDGISWSTVDTIEEGTGKLDIMLSQPFILRSISHQWSRISLLRLRKSRSMARTKL